MAVDPMGGRRQCTATSKQSGERCKRRPIPGGTVCTSHGGAAPAVRAAAERRKQEAAATALLEILWDPDAAPVTDPVERLAALAGRTEHALEVIGAKVEVEGLETAAGLAWTRVMRELRLQLEGLAGLGLEDRRVRISEEAGQLLASVVRTVLDRIELTPEQEALARVVVPVVFREAAGGELVVGEAEG